MAPSTEVSPLLPKGSDAHCILQGVDEACLKKFTYDDPLCPICPRPRQYLQSCTSPCGYGYPMHHHLQSPSHGFSFLVEKLKLLRFFPQQKPKATDVPSSQRFVFIVFILAVLTMVCMAIVSPTMVLYMNYVHFTSSTNITAYVTASAIASAVPVVSNIVFGRIASSIGPANALVLLGMLSALGMLLVFSMRSALWVFFLGYGLYSASLSMRIIRISILSQIVPEDKRTTVLATHSLMTPVGALVGPLGWIVLSRYKGSFSLGPLTIDRFALAYGTAATILVIISLISATRLRGIPTPEGNGSRDHFEPPSHVTIQTQNGDTTRVNLHEFRSQVFGYFCTIMFCVNMSSDIYMTAFQPILVNEFGVSDAKLGLIFEVIAMFAIVPPLLVALLSKYLMDRQIMVIGLFAKVLGMALFLPLFGPVREWQVIIGFMLIIKASVFFITACMSLFTKVLGTLSSSALIGLLASGSSVGSALAQVLIGDYIAQFFGGFKFVFFSLPAVVGMAAIVIPRYWKRLDPNCEFTKLIAEETNAARLQHQRRSGQT
ncbi:hypothetical protein BWQ96_08463 [Gracilariopsis chorda]|uniref:Major facilitator superfamily (MFS) profile domain-containing protein n=1 Tax=Gracilariopsis chorda TaxID=448386 RepID=A0A2V3II82_9FLOR|nr:hypothetical protein BWQ96_08463 [Gracilariopsis chorda]|eukprot:PXF41815.1 hypothetical protein BWQ96_08463 [Gracilariopsis chorda]